MAVFVCALDETAGMHHRDKFFMCGFVAPEGDWSKVFTPAWQDRVLDGPPRIPFLHMTDIRSPKWREEHGLSKAAADDRVDAAIDLIDESSNLFPIGIEVDAGQVRDGLSGMEIVHPNGGNAHFGPDYLCFLAYSYLVLSYIAKAHPNAEKVDFIIERNGRVTKYIQAFHSGLANSLAVLELSDLAKLVGEFIPTGKERVSVQAADVLCWHTARRRDTMDEADIRRYAKLARKTGIKKELTGEHIKELAVALLEP